MYIKVTFGGSLEDDKRQTNQIYVNPNCPIRMIYDFIKRTFRIKDELEFDLYNEEGSLLFIHNKDPWINGLEYLIPKKNYFVITFERDEHNRPMSTAITLPELLGKAQGNELLQKIHRQLNPGRGIRSAKTSRTRLTSASKLMKQT